MRSTPSRYYLVRPHPAIRGRWAVMHRVPGTSALHVDADALTLAGAEREAAWLEAERAGVSTWGDSVADPTPPNR